MKIILVDDVREPEWIRNPLDEECRSFKDIDVEIARNGEIGIQRLSEEKFDMLLLDHDMGMGKNGMDVLKFLIENENQLPRMIFLVTANVVAGLRMHEMLKILHSEGKIEDFGWIQG